MTLDGVIVTTAILAPTFFAALATWLILDIRAAKARRSTVTLLGPGAAMAARRARR